MHILKWCALLLTHFPLCSFHESYVYKTKRVLLTRSVRLLLLRTSDKCICGYILNMFSWWKTCDVKPPQPVQLRTSEVKKGNESETMYTSFSDFCSADSASDLSSLQSYEPGSWQKCLSFKLEAGEKREGGREAGRESEARGMIKGGAVLRVTHPNRQIYWKCKEGGASLKSHGTLEPITGQWLHGQLWIMMRPNQ